MTAAFRLRCDPRHCRGAIIFMIFLCSGSVSSSVELIDLYSVTIPVDSELQQERLLASQKALETVFIRVTGDNDALERFPFLAAKISSANQLLTSYSYFQDTVESHSDTATQSKNNDKLTDLVDLTEKPSQLMAEFVFKPQAVKQLLFTASAPFWQASRPEVLVWLVTQEGATRQIINDQVSPYHFGLLSQAARFRGIPIAQPLLDLEELSAIDKNDIWSLSIDKIEASSERYSHGAVLAGKISRANAGQWHGEWTLIYQGSYFRRYFSGTDLVEFSQLGIDLVADKMAEDYAVVTSKNTVDQQWLIKVDGINSLNDFTRLTRSLRSVPALETIRLHSVSKSRCYFYLDALVDLQKIEALLELNESLILQSPKGLISNTNRAGLHYVWREQ